MHFLPHKTFWKQTYLKNIKHVTLTSTESLLVTVVLERLPELYIDFDAKCLKGLYILCFDCIISPQHMY